jgi:hypothetical protein
MLYSVCILETTFFLGLITPVSSKNIYCINGTIYVWILNARLHFEFQILES